MCPARVHPNRTAAKGGEEPYASPADGRYDEGIKQSHDRYMARAISGAHLMILPGVSHFAAIQDPALFARAVLDELTAPWDD